jgi:hypothetical protein
MKNILKNNYDHIFKKNNWQKDVLEYTAAVLFKNLKFFYLNYIF